MTSEQPAHSAPWVVARSGLTAYAYEVENNKYIDYVGSWGPAIFGHANDKVNEATRWLAITDIIRKACANNLKLQRKQGKM